MNAKINTKRKRVKFASDNVTGACPEVLDTIIKANDGIAPPYGNDEISGVLQEKFSKIGIFTLKSITKLLVINFRFLKQILV